MTKQTRLELDFGRLRQQVRAILLAHGTAIAPKTETPEHVDELIDTLARSARPDVARESEALENELDALDDDLSRKVSNHFGAHMAAYGDAGYYTGLAMGLELAALTFGALATVPVIGSMRKRGRR